MNKFTGNLVFRKANAHGNQSLNLGGILCLLATVYVIYYLLIKDRLLPFCITSVLSWSSPKHWHVLAVGLVPIYLALMIFGAAMISIYLGSAIQRWLTERWLS